MNLNKKLSVLILIFYQPINFVFFYLSCDEKFVGEGSINITYTCSTKFTFENVLNNNPIKIGYNNITNFK